MLLDGIEQRRVDHHHGIRDGQWVRLLHGLQQLRRSALGHGNHRRANAHRDPGRCWVLIFPESDHCQPNLNGGNVLRCGDYWIRMYLDRQQRFGLADYNGERYRQWQCELYCRIQRRNATGRHANHWRPDLDRYASGIRRLHLLLHSIQRTGVSTWRFVYGRPDRQRFVMRLDGQ